MVDEAKGGKADAEKKYMDAAGQVSLIIKQYTIEKCISLKCILYNVHSINKTHQR